MGRIFNIGTVLTACHRKVLTDLDSIYDILNYILDDNLFTHQLPRASKFVTPFILAQHPQLGEWAEYDNQINGENYKEFISLAESMFGKELEIEKVPAGVWTDKDPIEEAEEMFSKDKIIKVTYCTKN